MVPHDDGVAPIQGIATDRHGQAGPAWPEGGRQSEVGQAPAQGASGPPRRGASGAADAPLPIQDTRITFEKDEESGKLVVQLKDASGRVIRQIPPEEMLRLAKEIDRYLGLLVDKGS